MLNGSLKSKWLQPSALFPHGDTKTRAASSFRGYQRGPPSPGRHCCAAARIEKTFSNQPRMADVATRANVAH
jgi:hypothetical protein